jgi:outer membrane protein assembly factor BamB
MSVTTPEVPVLKLPADGAEDVSLSPSFYWGINEEKKEDILYSLKIFRLTTGGTETVFQKTGLSESEFKLTAELEPSQEYFWRISYSTEKGDRVDSDYFYFDTASLPELELKIPSSKVFEGKTLNIDLKSFLKGLKEREVSFCHLSGPGEIKEGIYTFNPGFEDSGSYIVEVCAKGRFRETSQQFEITVLDTYRPMIVKNIQEDFEVKEGETFQINLNEKIENPEANLLTYSIVEGPGEIKDGIYIFEPDFTQQGKEYVKIRIEDPATEINMNFHIVISDVNQIPTLSVIPIQNIEENELLTLNLKEFTKDPDNDTILFELIQGPGELSKEGIYTFKPDFDSERDYFVSFSVNDGKESSEDKFSIIVANTNRLPNESLKIETQQTITENEELKINLNECYSDPDEDPLTFELVSGPGQILDGVYSYTPDFDSETATSISIEVSDGMDSIVKAYDLKIKNVNRSPEIKVSEPDKTRDVFALKWEATDPDDDPLLYDIYFSDHEDPILVSKNFRATEWTPAEANIQLVPYKEYFWKIVVKDSKGLEKSTPVKSVEFENKEPEKPLLTVDYDPDKVIALPFEITWISQDEDDGQNLYYDFYMGKEKDKLRLVAENLETESYSLSGLEGGQRYYWKIISKDNFGGMAESDIYSLTTNQPPLGPVNPGIKNGSSNVSSTNTALSWEIPENPDNDTLSYDIFIGTDSKTLKLVASDISEATYKLASLTGNEQYYWQIVTKDEYGEETAGPVWSFKTGFGPGAVEWEYKVKYDIRSSPAISDDGIIYFGADDDYLYAIDRDGNFVWKFNCGNVVFPSPSIGTDGTVYIATGNKYIYAIDKEGQLIWKKKIQGGCYSSPAVDKSGTVYIGDSTGVLHAISHDGKEIWTYSTEDEIRSSPAVGYSGTIYFGSDDGHLYALNSDGTLKWKYKTDGFVRSSPALNEDENIYIGSFDGHLYALNKNGALLWKVNLDSELKGSPSIYYDGTIYIGAYDGKLNAINADGTVKWSYKIEEGPFWSSSPAIGADGTVYIGTWEKTVLAIGADGEKKWCFKADDYIKSSPVIDIDGSLYIGTYGAKLYSIATDSMGLSTDSPWPMFRKDQKHTATQ